MKSALQLDPSLDLLGNRLPNVFIQLSKAGESLNFPIDQLISARWWRVPRRDISGRPGYALLENVSLTG
jgi:hypothetical protein